MAELKPWELDWSKSAPPVAAPTKKPWEEDWSGAPATVTETPSPTAPTPQPNVVRQREGMFLGDNYAPGGMDNPENIETFEAQGEPFTVLGIPIGNARVQDNGEGGRAFVSPPRKEHTTGAYYSPDELLDVFGGDEGSSERAIQGGMIQALKGTANFAAFMLSGGVDPNSPLGGPTVDMSKAINAANDAFQKWVPDMPAANNKEKMMQEIISMTIGLAGGGKIAEGLIESKNAVNAAPKSIKFLENFYKKALEQDPAKARAKLEAVTKMLMVETGGNIGATITAPDDSGSFTGGIADAIPGLDGAAANKVGIFADNMLFSGAIMGIAKAGGLTAQGLKKLINLKAGNPAEVAGKLLGVIDENVTPDLPAEEIARRVEILNDVVSKNKEFDFNLVAGTGDNTIPTDSASAMMLGATEYMRRVYEQELLSFPPEVADEFIRNRAQAMVENVMAVKQSLKANPIVAKSDANIATGFKQSMSDTSNAIATEKAAGQAIDKAGQPIVNQLNAQPPGTLATKSAETQLASMQNNNQLIKMISDARAKGVLGSTAEERATLANLSEEQLFQNYTKDKEAVDQLFKAIPHGQIPAIELAQAIKNAGDQEGLLRALGLSPGEAAPVSKVGDDFVDKAGKTHSPVNDLAATIEKMGLTDVNALINHVRPLIAQAKTNIKEGVSVNKDTSQYDALLNFINDVGKDQGDEFTIAMNEYKRFADKWLNTPPLAQFANAADKVRTIKTDGSVEFGPDEVFTPGGPAAREAGQQAFVQSADAMTGTYLEKFMDALRTGEGSQDEAMTYAMIGQAVNQMAKNPEIDSSIIQGAIQPYLKTLERIASTGKGEGAAKAASFIKLVNDTTYELQQLKSGLSGAKSGDDLANAVYEESMEQARKSALMPYIFQGENGARMADMSQINELSQKFFNGPQAVDRVKDVLTKAGDDPVVRDALKAEFMRNMMDKVFGRRGIGETIQPGTSVPQVARDLSPAGLQDVLDGAKGDTTLAVMKELFPPEDAQAITQLLQVMDVFVNGRAAKANPFGSNTVNDAQLTRGVNALITVFLGVLNPTATKARTFANLATGDVKKNTAVAIEKLLSRMVTDPTFLQTSMKALADDRTGKGLIPTFQRMISSGGAIAGRGVYNVAHPSMEEQTEEAIPGFKSNLGY